MVTKNTNKDSAGEKFIKKHEPKDDGAFLDAMRDDRKEFVENFKSRDFSASYLSEQYTDKAHFIFELLQNAEDAQAEQVCFSLSDNVLSVRHDGRVFSRRDIWSITTAGNSTKAEDRNTIGKFGVGFKSVFAVAEEPIIHSGNFHFKLKDMFVPHRIIGESQNSTEIILRLKKGEKLREKTIQTIKSLDAQQLLFLKNIKRVEWTIGEESGLCGKEEKHLSNYNNGIRLDEVNFYHNNNNSSLHTYLIFSREEIIAGRKHSLSVAYKSHNGKITKTETKTPLSVYFPLEKEKLGLAFLLHVPYRTTPDREKCDFSDRENEMLTDAATQIVADTLPILRDREMLTSNFIKNVLPWSDDEHEVYSKIKSSLTNKFLSDRLLPATDNRFCTAKEVIFTDQYIPKIMDATMVVKASNKEKYQNRFSWLKGDIGEDARKILKIPTYRISDLEDDVENDFLKRLDDINIKTFYRGLRIDFDKYSTRESGKRRYNHQQKVKARLTRLRSLPIIRLVNGEHLSAFDSENRPQVYLPSGKDDSRFSTVKPCLLDDDLAKKFLKDTLKLTVPDDIAEVRKILSTYADNASISDKQHIKDMLKILRVANDKPDSVKDVLANCPFVKSISGDGTRCFHAVNKSYFHEQDIARFFDDYSDAFFVDEDFYEEWLQTTDSVTDGWREIFSHFGVKENFQFINNYSPALEFALSRIDNSEGNDGFQCSLSIWRLLQKEIPNINDHTKNDLRQIFGKYSWMYTQNEKHIPVDQIEKYALGDVHPEYGKVTGDEERRSLAKIVGLKYDDVEFFKNKVTELEEQDHQKDEEINQLKEENHQLKEKLAQKEDSAETPTLPPFGEIQSGVLPSPRKKSRSPVSLTRVGVSHSAISGIGMGSDDAVVAHQSGKKGLQAEQKFLNFLKREYGDRIKWMNENLNNRGYDFKLINQNGETILIELKSFSTTKCPGDVELSASQMEFANNFADKFWLYVLYDCPDNPKQIRIENPGARKANPSRWKINIRESEC